MNRTTSQRRPGGFPRLCLAVMALALPWVCAAAELGFLKNSAVGRFDKEDVDLMMKNVGQVLESPSPHASQQWSNPKTGNSGGAEVVRTFQEADGLACKRLRVSNKLKRGNIEDQAIYTVCKYPDRGWLLRGD